MCEIAWDEIKSQPVQLLLLPQGGHLLRTKTVKRTVKARKEPFLCNSLAPACSSWRKLVKGYLRNYVTIENILLILVCFLDCVLSSNLDVCRFSWDMILKLLCSGLFLFFFKWKLVWHVERMNMFPLSVRREVLDDSVYQLCAGCVCMCIIF